MLVNRIKTTGCLKIMSVHLSQEKKTTANVHDIKYHFHYVSLANISIKKTSNMLHILFTYRVDV